MLFFDFFLLIKGKKSRGKALWSFTAYERKYHSRKGKKIRKYLGGGSWAALFIRGGGLPSLVHT